MPSAEQVVMADYVQQNNGVPSSARPLRGQACVRADPSPLDLQRAQVSLWPGGAGKRRERSN